MRCIEYYIYVHYFVRHLQYFTFLSDARVALLGFFLFVLNSYKRYNSTYILIHSVVSQCFNELYFNHTALL